MVGRVKTRLNQLYSAVETVEGLDTMREHTRQIQQNLLSLRRVLSIYFQIVLIMVRTIQKVEIVAPRHFVPLGGVYHSVVEYVNRIKFSKGIATIKGVI